MSKPEPVAKAKVKAAELPVEEGSEEEGEVGVRKGPATSRQTF